MKPHDITIGIIGYGNVGASLAFALHKMDFSVLVFARSRHRLMLPKHCYLPSLKNLLQQVHIIIIAVPDNYIEKVVKQIASTQLNLDKKIVFHTSGAITSQVLIPIQVFGASIASLHPLQTFPHAAASLAIWKNIYCVLEGDPQAIKTGKVICRYLRMKPLVLPAKKKIFYHAAAVFASNLLVLLINISQQIAHEAGINKKHYKSLYYPLIIQSIENIMNKQLHQALSGPLVRKDKRIIKAHLDAIKPNHPFAATLYSVFAAYYYNAMKGLR
jgi:predicted short-subunit dehydrogenase-like oxidoreductase (DUF2520 family)